MSPLHDVTVPYFCLEQREDGLMDVDAATLLSANRAIRAETVVLAAKIAVETDDLPRVHSILRAGVSERMLNGLVHVACRSGSSGALALLVDRPCNLGLTQKGDTPLDVALSSHRAENCPAHKQKEPHSYDSETGKMLLGQNVPLQKVWTADQC